MSLEVFAWLAIGVVAIAFVRSQAINVKNNAIADTVAKLAENFRSIYAERGTEGLLRALKENESVSHFHDARSENDLSKRVYFQVPALPEFFFYILDSGPHIDPILCVKGEGTFRGFEASAGMGPTSPAGSADAHEALGNDPTKRAKTLAATFQRRHGWTAFEAFKGWRKGVYVGN